MDQHIDRFDKAIYEILKRKHPDVDDAEISRWMNSTNMWAHKNIISMRKWVAQIQLMMRKELDDVHVDSFFIRLYGLLVDIPNYVTPNLKVFRDESKKNKLPLKEIISKNITRDASMRLFLCALVDVEEALRKIGSGFSAEDIFSTTYFRHSHCHPVLKDYKVKLRVDGKILTFDAKKYEKFLEHNEVDELKICEKSFRLLQAMRAQLAELEACLQRLQ